MIKKGPLNRLLILGHFGILAMFASCRSSTIVEPPKFHASYIAMEWREYFLNEKLRKLIEAAIQGNADLAVATERVAAARAQLAAASGLLLPVVQGLSQIGARRFGLYTMDGAGNKTTPIYRGRLVPRDLPDYQLAAQASWEIDLWGRLSAIENAAVHRTLASQEGRRLIQTMLISEVASAYYEVLALDASKRVVDSYIEVQRQSVDAIGAQQAAGAANQLARQQFEARLRQLESSRVEIDIALATAETTINSLIGRGAQSIDRSPMDAEIAQLPPHVYAVPAELLRNRPDVRQAEYELAAARADVEAAAAAFLPSVNISAAAGIQAFRPDLLLDRGSIIYSLLGGITAPIFNRTALEATLSLASAMQREALVNYRRVLNDSALEVHQHLVHIQNFDQVEYSLLEQAKLETSSEKVAQALFATGRSTYIELLGIRQARLEVEMQVIDTRRRKLQTLIGLFRAIGGGVE